MKNVHSTELKLERVSEDNSNTQKDSLHGKQSTVEDPYSSNSESEMEIMVLPPKSSPSISLESSPSTKDTIIVVPPQAAIAKPQSNVKTKVTVPLRRTTRSTAGKHSNLFHEPRSVASHEQISHGVSSCSVVTNKDSIKIELGFLLFCMIGMISLYHIFCGFMNGSLLSTGIGVIFIFLLIILFPNRCRNMTDSLRLLRLYVDS